MNHCWSSFFISTSISGNNIMRSLGSLCPSEWHPPVSWFCIWVRSCHPFTQKCITATLYMWAYMLFKQSLSKLSASWGPPCYVYLQVVDLGQFLGYFLLLHSFVGSWYVISCIVSPEIYPNYWLRFLSPRWMLDLEFRYLQWPLYKIWKLGLMIKTGVNALLILHVSRPRFNGHVQYYADLRLPHHWKIL